MSLALRDHTPSPSLGQQPWVRPPFALTSLDKRQTHRARPWVIRPRLNHRGGAGHPGTGDSCTISPEEPQSVGYCRSWAGDWK